MLAAATRGLESTNTSNIEIPKTKFLILIAAVTAVTIVIWIMYSRSANKVAIARDKITDLTQQQAAAEAIAAKSAPIPLPDGERGWKSLDQIEDYFNAVAKVEFLSTKALPAAHQQLSLIIAGSNKDLLLATSIGMSIGTLTLFSLLFNSKKPR